MIWFLGNPSTVVFKKKAKKPVSSASLPRNHYRHTCFPSSTWHYIGKEDLHSTTSASPNTSCAQEQVVRIRQKRAGSAVPQLSLQQAIARHGNPALATRIHTATERLPGCTHHTCTSPAIRSSELENLPGPTPLQALPKEKSAVREQFCLWVPYSQAPTAAFLRILL